MFKGKHRTLFQLNSSTVFLDPPPTLKKKRGGDLIKHKRLFTAEEIINKKKKTTYRMGEVTGKGLISKQLIQINIKNTTTQSKNWWKNKVNISPKKIHRWTKDM